MSSSGALQVEYNIRSLIVQLYPGIEYINTAGTTTTTTTAQIYIKIYVIFLIL